MKSKILTVNLNDDVTLGFKTVDDLKLWCHQEREAWKWMGEAPLVNDRRLRNVWGPFDVFYNNIQQAIANFENAAGDFAQFESAVQGAFNNSVATRRVAIRENVHGARIMAVLARYGGLVSEDARRKAASAHYYVSGLDNSAQIDGSHLRTAVLSLIDYENAQGSSHAAEASTKELMRRTSEELTQNQLRLKECANQYVDHMSQWSGDIRRTIEHCEAKSNDAVAEINRIKGTL
jgi:hypothetical protein